MLTTEMILTIIYALTAFLCGNMAVVAYQNFTKKPKKKPSMDNHLGKKMRCLVTGFEGIATAKVEYLNGCCQYLLKPKVADGKMVDGEYIDHQQLEVVGDGVTISQRNTGGPATDAPKHNGLSRN